MSLHDFNQGHLVGYAIHESHFDKANKYMYLNKLLVNFWHVCMLKNNLFNKHLIKAKENCECPRIFFSLTSCAGKTCHAHR